MPRSDKQTDPRKSPLAAMTPADEPENKRKPGDPERPNRLKWSNR
jgi:hypothetical protein